MGPVAGPRPFDGNRNSQLSARGGEGRNIGSPFGLVEVGGDKPARLVGEQGIAADHVTTLEVIEDHLVGHRQKRLAQAVATTDAWLLADSSHPLVAARRGVPLLVCLRADPELREHVLPALEETPEECNLLLRVQPTSGSRRRDDGAAFTVILCAEIVPEYLDLLLECGPASAEVGDFRFCGLDGGAERCPSVTAGVHPATSSPASERTRFRMSGDIHIPEAARRSTSGATC